MKKVFLFFFFFLDICAVPTTRSSSKKMVPKSDSGVKKPLMDIQCPVCPNRVFNSVQPLNGLVQHLIKKHDLHEVGCLKCGKKFDPTRLQNHLRDTQHGDYYSALCAVYANKKEINAQTLDVSLTCKHCNRSFTSYQDLNRHFRAIKIAISRQEGVKRTSSIRECRSCNFKGVNFASHLKKCHPEISIDERHRILAATALSV